MQDQNAAKLLAKVMRWNDEEVSRFLPKLLLLADYKYDHYQRFGPGRRFIENLALWLNQFAESDRKAALELVTERLIYFSDAEFSHLVRIAYPDVIDQECMRLVAEEHDIPSHRVQKIVTNSRFKELKIKSLYLGLSDGARTNELRRASGNSISNEQIWQAYELGEDKAKDMTDALEERLKKNKYSSTAPRFNLIWLLDDFSGSGYTYIRYVDKGIYKGKIWKIYDRLHRGGLVDPTHYEVFLLLYVATRQAVDHIEYWAERFTSEFGYKPLQIRVLCIIEQDIAILKESSDPIFSLANKPEYYDNQANDKHIEIGGTADARLGFAGCALPVVLSHNTPNNSIYLLWGQESFDPFGLFPRMSRHKEF
ncbi:MAG: hypothetical protein MI685_01790 [Chlorobiales bacterium]|nr:hypothetical protein [Chlorobiales bacterium]